MLTVSSGALLRISSMDGTFLFVSFILLLALSLFPPRSRFPLVLFCLYSVGGFPILTEDTEKLHGSSVFIQKVVNRWASLKETEQGECFLEETPKCHYQPSLLFLASSSPSALPGAPSP